MKTSTHYTDARGQHYLPECMLNREIVVDTIIAADYATMDPRDASEIMEACRALGIDTETDEDGALVAESVEQDNLRHDFEADDRYCTLTPENIACHGSAANAVAWLLDPANATSFCAVLDPRDLQVATLEDGEIVWQPLDDFYALEAE